MTTPWTASQRSQPAIQSHGKIEFIPLSFWVRTSSEVELENNIDFDAQKRE